MRYWRNQIPRVNLASVAVFLCFLGMGIRAYFYGLNRSLWLDEIKLALNLVDRSFYGLLAPLSYEQGAPIGFILIEKFFVSLFGTSEYVFRLFPFLAGIASLPLAYKVSQRYTKGPAPLVVLALVGLSWKLTYYATELKQYSSDVFFVLLLLLTAHKCLEQGARRISVYLLGIVGLLSIWSSHPAVFILPGIGIALAVQVLKQKEYQRFFLLAGVGIFWIANFGVLYFLSLRHLTSSSELVTFWKVGFAPLPPWSDPGWYYHLVGFILQNPVGLPATYVTAGLLIVGALSLLYRRWPLFLILILPFLLTLAASGLKKYPVSGRLMLFAVPLVFMVAAEGIDRIWSVSRGINKAGAFCIAGFLSLYLIYGPAVQAYQHVMSPPMGEHIKPVLSYLARNLKEKDVIHVYYGARMAFEFYAPRCKLTRADYSVSVKSPEAPGRYLAAIDEFKGRERVWFVFSHNCSWCQVDEEGYITGHLNQIGRMTDHFSADGAAVYLYDLE